MKSKAIAILATLVIRSLAQDAVRELYRGGGGGGRGGGRGGRGGGGKGKDRVERLFKANCYWGEDESTPLISRINEKCDGYDCMGFTECLEWETIEDDILIEGCDDDMSKEYASDLKDTINTALQVKREKFKEMSKEDRANYRQQKEDMQQRNAENVMNCGCCADNPDFQLGELVDKIEGAVAKTLGFDTPKGDSVTCVGRLQAMVDAKCPDFISSCPDEAIDIGRECVLEKPERPKVDWAGISLQDKIEWKEQRNEFKTQVLKCSCCTGIPVAVLFGDTSAESEEETEVEANELLGIITEDRPSSSKIQLTIPLPNRPYRPHRRRQQFQF